MSDTYDSGTYDDVFAEPVNIDILTFAEGARALQRGATTFDQDTEDELRSYITAATLRLEQEIGAVVRRTITETLDGMSAHGFVGPRGGSYYGSRFGSPLFLASWPVTTIVSVAETWGGTTTTLTSADYTLDPDWGALWRGYNGMDRPWLAGRRNIVVTYIAGRADTTALVDQRIKRACQVILIHMWSQDHSQGGLSTDGETLGLIRTFSVPKRALDLVCDLVRPEGVG